MKYQPVISQQVRLDLNRKFTKRIDPFLNLYEYLFARSTQEDWEKLRYAPAMNIDEISKVEIGEFLLNIKRVILAGLNAESVKDFVVTEIDDLRILSARLQKNVEDRFVVRMFVNRLRGMIESISSDVEVFLIGKPVPGNLGFVRFRKATEDEEQIERIKHKDPELYSQIHGSKDKLREISGNITKAIEEEGLEPGRMRINGRSVQIGTDKKTKEVLVYSTNGDILSIPVFKEKLRQEEEALKRLQNIKDPDLDDLSELSEKDISRIQKGFARKTDRVFIPNLENLRTFPQDQIPFLEGEVEFLSLTDDKSKQSGVVRVYPTKKTPDGKSVVIKGRFKGVYVEDLVNQVGRLIEGTAYDFNAKTKERTKIQSRDAEGKITLSVNREPYVTVGDDEKLLIKIPRNTEHTEMRQAMKALLKQSATIQYQDNTSGTTYTFDPKDFGMVKNALGGMALSKGASEKVAEYYDFLAKISAAQTPEVANLYSAKKIGGFKEGFEFRTVQKQSLAWCEARGWSGMVALSVGLGKTNVAVGAMQKMYRDGLTGENGKFLYVCTNSLKGNLPRELKFSSEDADEILKRTDIISYEEFTRKSNQSPGFADTYTAVFFDECQELRTKARLKAVSDIKNPRKIFLSASPMGKDPDEAFVNVMLTNNVQMYDNKGKMKPEIIAARKAWRNRYTEVVGGRVMGIKQDPLIRQEFHQWVASNIFYRSPEDAPEINMPELRVSQETLVMDPKVEALYRKSAKEVSSVINDIVRKYEQMVKDGLNPKVDSFKGGAIGKALRGLQRLQDMPDTVVPGARNPKMDRTIQILDDRLNQGSRALMFTDNNEFADYTVNRVSKEYPGKKIGVAYPSRIEVWQNGKKQMEYTEKTKFDRGVKSSEWRSYVLSDLLQSDPSVMALILTAKYSVGQNLQGFSTIIQLDRDTWSGETMKQRTGRSHRQGQKHPVEEYILDAVYGDVKGGKKDFTLDEARGAVHRMENRLFDEIIVQAQAADLGEDYLKMKKMDASLVAISRKLMESAISPYATRIAESN
jgi:hypothetical protein